MAIYQNGTIAIPNVTGDIVINVTAVQSAAPIENLAETYGYSNGNRVSLSTGANSAAAGYCAVGATNNSTGIFSYSAGDVFRIKGATLPALSDSGSSVVVYSDTSGTHLQLIGEYLYQGQESENTKTEYDSRTGIITVTMKRIMFGNTAGYCPFMRLSLKCSDGSKLVVTKNQEIPTVTGRI